MRYLIKNGIIYDGDGGNPFRGDILIENEIIQEIGTNLTAPAEIINAAGQIVAPGFIDTHRHCDLAALLDQEFGTIELHQGLTSVAGGNCGLGIFPAGRNRKDIYDFVEPCLGAAAESLSISGYEEYGKRLEEKGLPLHTGLFLGTGAVKAAIKGYGNSPFTVKEMELAKGYIRENLESGVLGLSMGIMYQPECYSSYKEMTELLKTAAPYGRPLMCHIRGEGDSLVSSVREVIGLCQEAELPLNISHFKATGIRNWNKTIYKAIEAVEEARNRGQDVTADFYPYCGGSTTLLSLLPPSVIEGSLEESYRKLHNKHGIEKLKKELYKEQEGWDNMVTSIGWSRILISSVTKESNRILTGLDFEKAADIRGYEDPAELMADLLYEENGKVGIILLSMSQEDVDTVARLPYTMLISDSLYGRSDCPHPRLYGSFPRLIRDFVRERRILTMESAIQKMTSMPADRLNLKKRGRLKDGYYADMVVFHQNRFTDHGDYSNPKQLSSGLSYVFVDGKMALCDDQRLHGSNGKVLRIN